MLTLKIDTSNLNSIADTFSRQLYNKIQDELQYEGESLVKHARDLSPMESYNDQTGNLRSSIGFATYANGQETTKSDFPQVPPKIKDTEGVVFNGKEQGEQCIEEHKGEVSRCTHGLVLVAGMEYASYVEKMESKNVLAKTELKATQDMVSILDNLKKKFKI